MNPVDDEELLRRRVGAADVAREAFDAVPVAVCVLEGPEHRLVAANAMYRALVGRSDFLGGRMRDVFSDSAGQRLYEVIERVYATGEPFAMHEWRVQIVVDERGEPREQFVSGTITPRYDAHGVVHGVHCYLTEVTAQVKERRAARAEALAVERRYRQALDVVATLQTELLPAGLPVLPRAQIAATYLLAQADTAAGGDWFDALPLPDGRVALMVGDVVGHGVAASAVMGQLRAVLAERLSAGVALPEALAAVDAVADRTKGARAATTCVAVLDPADGALSYCTAGHPPPLLVPADGETRYLPTTGAGPLGTGAEFVIGDERLRRGDVLLLYTDGIVERPGRETVANTVELAQVVTDLMSGRGLRDPASRPVDRVAAQTLELLVRDSGHADDITLLAVQRAEPPPDLAVRHRAAVSAVGAVRVELGSWLRAVGAVDPAAITVQHAVGELVTNAVEHAYEAAEAPDATVEVRGHLDADGTLHVAVTDHGRWRGGAAPSTNEGFGRGRGLAMSRSLVDALVLDRRPDGTTATVRHRLTRPARLLTADEIVSGPRQATAHPDETPLLLVLDQPVDGQHPVDGEQVGVSARVRVDGPVDVATAPQLEAELRWRTHGGSRALTVDLTGVTLLSSAGVAVLHHATRVAAPDAPLRLYAPVESAAAHVLSLVALSNDAEDPHGGRP